MNHWPAERPGTGRFCLIIAGDQPMLYHQIALRLALDGYTLAGAASVALNLRLSREIEDAGGHFYSSAVSELTSGDSALVILESDKPFEPLHWSAQRRVHISSQLQPASSPLWKSAVIRYPQSLAQAVIADIVDQVAFLLRCPPCAHAIWYNPLPDGRHFKRTTRRLTVENAEQSEVLPLEGVEVRSTLHGHGVFATQAYRRGELVMATRGVLLDHQTEHSIQVSLTLHLEPRFPVRLINHSCEPNLGVRTNVQGLPDFYAFRDIRAGEQLTFDYAMTELLHVPRLRQELEFSLQCWCGTPGCRQQLGYYATLPAALKRQYAGYLSKYLLEIDGHLLAALEDPAAKPQEKTSP